MVVLLGALVAPVVGAILYRFLHNSPRLTRAFDLSMYLTVPLLIGWQVFGHVVDHRGWDAAYILMMLGVMGLGFGLPILIEHLYHQTRFSVELLSVLAGLTGLAFHAVLEGISLQGEIITITAPILLHRLMVGLMIWWVLFPRYGRWPAAAGIGSLLAATTIGFSLGGMLPEAMLHGTSGEMFQAFVAGSLLHVVLHESAHGSPHDHSNHNQ
ncbi:MAG: hypothetical protein OXM02_02460 [Bacteroidota bacterium]|nr:hypothetical protein [Bacteroidota bacterium]MDE2833365.1 hypothetical protein [Bacteroidota bacterium]MDE2957386.1 hypothetical protein [Bacteroidota bacterium]